jgi:hypothetical protein
VAAQYFRLPGERGPGFIDLGQQPVRGPGVRPVLPQGRPDAGQGVLHGLGPIPLASGDTRGQSPAQMVQGGPEGVAFPCPLGRPKWLRHDLPPVGTGYQAESAFTQQQLH